MLIIKQSLDFVLTARSKQYIFITSCQGRLVLSTVTRSEITVSDNIDLQVLQTGARGYSKRFSTSTIHCFYKNTEQVYQVCLSVIGFQQSIHLTLNDKLDVVKFFILYCSILSIISLSDYVSVLILSMYSNINCLAPSSSDKRLSLIESSKDCPDAIFQSFAASIWS